ncbi:histidine phosphatase family protein [Bombilactobacillus thymidiniphilus]|uniref:Histidine phosphatase family protein n=1 Tax=Bombilactobacillus thymidiniphilus TaxID=2923363 RepID=A0ABY4PDY2_9LACO|nr:histidine phosphatase family protein [Bombilactobacillus thymidiniphilus]UQS83775.1 histidine phosphatase family protein [Bombilactobacillus thymidiniphilus]
MTTFYFVRHGKTQWNSEGRYQGAQGDSPLLPASYHDIELLAQHLKPIHIDHIYTSPLQRAYITAKTLDNYLGGTIPITRTVMLKEFNLGILEGQKFVDAERQYPQLIWSFRHDPSKYDPTPIKGESFAQVIERTTNFIKDLAQNDLTHQQNFVIVSHGAALVAMIKSLLGISLGDLRKDGGMANTGLTTLITKDQGENFELVKWNDTSYLKRDLNSTDTV